MARPREFEEAAVLDAAMHCFWAHGYDETSVRDLVEEAGITAASLYNAFGDKRSLYGRALDRYVDVSIRDRIRRCEAHGTAREAIEGFFSEILQRSLGDTERKGCMLVNAGLDIAPHDPKFQDIVAGVLVQIEAFFLRYVEAGRADGTISGAAAPADRARHILGALMGVRVLARVRPERVLIEAVVSGALAELDRAPPSSPRSDDCPPARKPRRTRAPPTAAIKEPR